MKKKNENLVKVKLSRKIFLKRNHTKLLQFTYNIISPTTNYLKSYSKLNELMSNNDFDKADDAPKYTFVDNWGKHD